MTNSNEIPYGALYSFQPEYMAEILHEEHLNHPDDASGTPKRIILRLVSSCTAPFTKAS